MPINVSICNPWSNTYIPEKSWSSNGTPIEQYIPPGAETYVFDAEAFKKTMQTLSVKKNNSAWREALVDDILHLSTDVPGMHVKSLNLSVEDGVLKLIGQRFDTNEIIEKSFNLTHKYDPDTIHASLTHGVLVMTIKVAASAKNKKINVIDVDM